MVAFWSSAFWYVKSNTKGPKYLDFTDFMCPPGGKKSVLHFHRVLWETLFHQIRLFAHFTRPWSPRGVSPTRVMPSNSSPAFWLALINSIANYMYINPEGKKHSHLATLSLQRGLHPLAARISSTLKLRYALLWWYAWCGSFFIKSEIKPIIALLWKILSFLHILKNIPPPFFLKKMRVANKCDLTGKRLKKTAPQTRPNYAFY